MELKGTILGQGCEYILAGHKSQLSSRRQCDVSSKEPSSKSDFKVRCENELRVHSRRYQLAAQFQKTLLIFPFHDLSVSQKQHANSSIFTLDQFARIWLGKTNINWVPISAIFVFD
ncbi:hypothetical protein LWI29_024456 [Acer saccharum]|uniref:Uncharacterized protein n=1 Tax=Acer saccharum TaxID=4024 RepID=A0AA39S4Y6_ACESA|nr:hypothetical protein LWI29_024456 [Acer saccharum]